MSYNQSRSEKSDITTTQHRKSGRSSYSNSQRSSSSSSSSAYSKGGGGASGPSPSPSVSSSWSLKKANNATSGQSRVNAPAPAPAPAPVVPSSDSRTAPTRNVQNGATHAQLLPPLHGVSNAPVSSVAAKRTGAAAFQRSTPAVPKAPTSQPPPMNLDSAAAAPTPPVKVPGGASKAFPFQFGSLSPGFMNGMQIPARTSSAPPNLDEQKQDQVRHDSSRVVPPMAAPIPKQQPPRKDANMVEKASGGDIQRIPKAKKESEVPPPLPPVSQAHQPPALPFSVNPMQLPFHQPQKSVQFAGPNLQIQPQGVTSASLPIPFPVALPLGNGPQVQTPMFVQGLQPLPLQTQGIMHQGQGLSFPTQMGTHLPPQLGNMGMGIGSQYPRLQGANLGSQRRTTVKITDPRTHEELRLVDGGSSGSRSHLSVPQSQPISSYPPPHAVSYYSNSYGSSNIQPISSYPPPQGSLPLPSGQIAPISHPPRFNFTVGPATQSSSYMDPSVVNSLPISKSGAVIHAVAEPSNSEHSREMQSLISSVSSGTVKVTIKPAAASTTEKSAKPSLLDVSSHSEQGGAPMSLRSSAEASVLHYATVQRPNYGSESAASKSLPVTTQQFIPDNVESTVFHSSSSFSVALPEESSSSVTLTRSNCSNNQQKKMDTIDDIQPQDQVDGQSTLESSLPPHTLDCNKAVGGRDAETVEAKTGISPFSVSSEGLTEVSMVGSLTTGVFESKHETGDGSSGGQAEALVVKINADASETVVDYVAHENPKDVCSGVEQVERGLPAGQKADKNCLDIISAPVALNSVQSVEPAEGELSSSPAKSGNEVLENSLLVHVEPVICQVEKDRISDVKDVSILKKFVSDFKVEESLALGQSSSRNVDAEDKAFPLAISGVSDLQHDTIAGLDSSQVTLKQEDEALESTSGSSTCLSGGKDKPIESTQSKSTTSRVKRKEFLQKADALGNNSDLYIAYKGPEDKKENIVSVETLESTSSNLRQWQASYDVLQVNTAAGGQATTDKTEPDDWEDVVDMSTPKLETSDLWDQDGRGLMSQDEEGNANSDKKYSRDFLMKFSERCTDLPDGFEVPSDDILEALMSPNVDHIITRDSHPSPGRVIDRTNSASRMDRRGSGVADDDRWGKLPGTFSPGRDLHVDIGFPTNPGFRSIQGGNFGVLRNPRAQAPMQYMGGILSVPMQSMVPQGGVPRSGLDADRWQRATSFQHRGLIPSPQTPLQVMHKAEKKYEVGKVTDEEQAKQRQLTAILNKLTPQNFEKLFDQVKAVNIDNPTTLLGVISQIFDKALMEPTFCEMYANFCFHLAGELPNFSEDNEKITFKGLLLNKCQEEFERGEREQEEANKADEEGEIKQSEEEREEKRVKARRRMLGNIRLIGELYKKRMLTEKIMHACIQKLFGHCQNPDEEDVEALCKLMSTIGEMIDYPKVKPTMDAYFKRMAMLSDNMNLSSRIRFMLKDVIDLRRNKWQQRRKVEGPKKIDDVHRDAAQERQLQAGRLVRNLSTNQSARRVPFDFGPRGTPLPASPNTLMGGFRGSARGYGTQDTRFEERQSYEVRTMAVPLPQRSLGNDSITLGPQGGLARGMSVRGAPAIASAPVADPGDSRRLMAAFNGSSNMADRSTYNTREDLLSPYVPERSGGPTAYDQFRAQERNMNYNNRDPHNVERGFERPIATSPTSRLQPSAFKQNSSSEMSTSEEHLQAKSMATIKEFYSARDEKEVESCIKELNSPGFHHQMISLWLTDSFEREQMERDLLAKLIVSLARSQDRILTHPQLLKGFDSVLTILEDAVTDAPRAAEFLGHMFARVVLENVISLREIGQLLHEGGEEQGRLLEVGLAGDVLGSVLETIKLEKGDTFLNQIKATCYLPLEDFRPPGANRSRTLEKFI